MVDVIELTLAMVDTLQRIPPLLALLDSGAASIVGYVDENPQRNSLSKAVYQMPPGSLLLSWQGTVMEQATSTMFAWNHVIQIFVRARKGDSLAPRRKT